MKHLTKSTSIALLLTLILLLTVSTTPAQSGGASTMLCEASRSSNGADSTGYDLSWWTVDGGGGSVSGSGYTLGGTAGQPDAGLLTDGTYILVGGFWGSGAVEYDIYLPLVLRNLS